MYALILKAKFGPKCTFIVVLKIICTRQLVVYVTFVGFNSYTLTNA